MTAAPYSVALRAAYCDDVFRDERAIDHRLRIGGTWAMGLGVAGVTTGTALLIVGDRSDSEKWTTAGEVTLISGGVVLLGGVLLRWLAPAHQRRAENAARLTTEILAASELRSEETDHGRAGSAKRLEARTKLDNTTGQKLAECFGQDPGPSPEPRTTKTNDDEAVGTSSKKNVSTASGRGRGAGGAVGGTRSGLQNTAAATHKKDAAK